MFDEAQSQSFTAVFRLGREGAISRSRVLRAQPLWATYTLTRDAMRDSQQDAHGDRRGQSIRSPRLFFKPPPTRS